MKPHLLTRNRQEASQPGCTVSLKIFDYLDSPYALPVFRVSGHYLLALICYLTPSIGENHILLAWILALVIAPVTLLLNIWLSKSAYTAYDSFIDLGSALLVVHIIPESWHLIMLVGLVVALSP